MFHYFSRLLRDCGADLAYRIARADLAEFGHGLSVHGRDKMLSGLIGLASRD